jgi:uncharacterized protein with gpF-like domain
VAKVLRPVRPNVGIQVTYQRRLDRFLDEMHRSLAWWLTAAYRKNRPEVAQDESPARILGRATTRLTRFWLDRIEKLAPELAAYFAQTAATRSDAALRHTLKVGGFSVDFRMTRAMNDVFQATVQENVSLIRSIAQQHLGQVEQLVMRSVQAGRDLETLSQGLQHQLGVSKRRAKHISLDQNNKATGAMQRVRQLELNIQTAIWVHSTAGKTPRRSHVEAGRDKVEYDIATGWWDPDERRYIFPGELINCRCVSRPVLPGFA